MTYAAKRMGRFRSLIAAVVIAAVGVAPAAPAGAWIPDPQPTFPPDQAFTYDGGPFLAAPWQITYDPAWGGNVSFEDYNPFLYSYTFTHEDGSTWICLVYWGGEVCNPLGQ